MREATIVDAIPEMKVNYKARANLVKWMAYDELVRKQSIERSTKYVQRHEIKAAKMPEWMWITLWVVMGVLGVISLDVVVTNWYEIIRSWF